LYWAGSLYSGGGWLYWGGCLYAGGGWLYWARSLYLGGGSLYWLKARGRKQKAKRRRIWDAWYIFLAYRLS